ncbi:hypothetical protein Taro_025036 [Colocasia esculenta]|uniref:Uncharacterized protein n=1 Tax=Colocasia esculenta TaxID=4460 RepID=A0A843VGC0_COLES|nr:hypothetical protein [Colocasia esculenta]
MNGVLASRKTPRDLNGSEKLSLGSPKKLLETLYSGFLSSIHSKLRSGRPPSSIQQLLEAAGGRIKLQKFGFWVPKWGFSSVQKVGSEKLPSISLDAGISVGVHGVDADTT